MKGRQDIDYFRIGIFVIVGLVLIILAVMTFSSMQLFSKQLYFETYFNESVEGLAIGSPVKYRGIEIGHIKDIELVASVYPEANDHLNNIYGRYIYVLMSIDPDFLPNTTTARVTQILRREIQAGLRTTLTLQGLTGGAYLSLNFVDPTHSKDLPIDWKPNNYYIPSATSTLTQFSESLGTILTNIQAVNFQQLSDNTNKLLAQLTHLTRKLDSLVSTNKNNITHIIQNVDELTDTLKDNPSAIVFSHPQPLDPSKL